MGLIYRKSLRLSQVKGGAGAVLNLMTSDVNKINDAVLNFHFLWGAFMEVALIIGLSVFEIGVSALPGIFFILLLLPIQMYLGKRTNDLGREQAAKTTERVHLMSELLTAVKLIKVGFINLTDSFMLGKLHLQTKLVKSDLRKLGISTMGSSTRPSIILLSLLSL